MTTRAENKFAQFLVVTFPVLITLFITPSYSSEPVDLPKLFLLVPFGFTLIGLTAQLIYSKFRVTTQISGILVSLFVLQLTLVLFATGAPFNTQFFGAMGRNTGFLAYLSLAFIFISTQVISNAKLIEFVAKSLMFGGILSTGYGLLQFFGHDPVKWNNPYSPIIGFLGNPDFTSAFIGFSSAIVIAILFDRNVNVFRRICITLYLLAAIFTVLKSHAQQGILVLGIDFVIVIYMALVKSKSLQKIYSNIFIMVSGAVGLVVLLGIFKIGPLSNYLYKISVRQRGFYWHAAIRMLTSHPLFGVGLDSYGDWYFGTRSANAAFHTLATQSNAAHNVYLDIASNGGFPLFLIYVALVIFILIRGVRVLNGEKDFNPYFVGVFAAWVGYQAQSIISINQLGLAVWGWTLGGLIVGYSYIGAQSTKDSNPGAIRVRRVKTTRNSLVAPTIVMTTLGLTLVIPALQTDHNYRVAASARDGQALFKITSQYPESVGRTLSAAQLFANSKLVPQALELAKRVSQTDPREYNAWTLIAQLTDPKSEDHAKAVWNMKMLNPQDSTIK